MAKKKSKQQPEQQTANISNPKTEPTAATSLSQPADTSQVDTQVPAAATRLQFFDFITLAATDDIKEFLKLASTKPEGENLATLWRRAHYEGYENGRKSVLRNLEKKMEEKYEEGVERGMNLGREEGFTVARDGFRRALASKKANTNDAGTQTGTTTTSATSFDETEPIDKPAPAYSASGMQTSSTVISRSTTSRFIQTDSADTHKNFTTKTTTVSEQTTPQTPSTSPSSSPVIATSPPSLSTKPSSQLPMLTTPVANSIHTAPICFEIPRKRLQSLPNHPEALRLSFQATVTHPVRRRLTITSLTLTAASPSTTTLHTSNQAAFSDQEAPATSETTYTTYTTSNEVQGCPKTQETKATGLCDDEQTGTFKRAVSSLERAGSPQNFVRRSRSSSTPSSSPQPIPMSRKPAATMTTPPTSKETPYTPSITISNHTPSPSSTTAPGTQSITHSLIQKHPEFSKMSISEHFSWADDAYVPPTTSTSPSEHPPRDFSCLRSTSTYPFSSLRRRCHRPKWQQNNQCRHNHSCHWQYPQRYQHYPSPSYQQLPRAVSLDWDRDPRLTDLNNALRALGWHR